VSDRTDLFTRRRTRARCVALEARLRALPGFTLLELLVVVAFGLVVMAMAVPSIIEAQRQYTLNSATRMVAAELRQARFAAVAKNRPVMVRFDCPAAGQIRMVEVVTDPAFAAINADPDRCSETAYPFPDPDPAVPPTIDGPVARLPAGTSLQTFTNVTFDRSGRTPGVQTIQVTNGFRTRTITVTQAGRVQE
jgi:type II secretory pathway pseudopilin PulG